MAKKFNAPLVTLISVFFFWGFIAASNTVLIGLFKKNFELSQFQSQLVDFAFYAAYFVGSLIYFVYSRSFGDPLAKIGYKKGLVVGLCISAVGAGGFYFAGEAQSFEMFLGFLFTIGIGFALLQIVANPYVIAIGNPETGSHRVSLAGGINSLGTMIGPLLLMFALFGNIHGSEEILVDGDKSSASIARTTNQTQTTQGKLFARGETYDIGEYIPAGQETIEDYMMVNATDSALCHTVYSRVLKNSEMPGLTINNGIYLIGNDSTLTTRVNELKEAFPKRHSPILTHESDEPDVLMRELDGKPISVSFLGVDAIKTPSLILAASFLLFALLLGFSKLPSIVVEKLDKSNFRLKDYPQIIYGMIAIFVYVGTEVTVQSNLPEFILQKTGLEYNQSVHFISLYWGSLMIGRWAGAITVFGVSKQLKQILTTVVPLIAYAVIIGANYLKGSPIDDLLQYAPFVFMIIIGFYFAQEKPARTMIIFGIGAAIMMGLGMVMTGKTAIYFFVSGGLFCSVMWPCIFSLSIAGLGKHTSKGSSLLIMMILGGAIIPPFQGFLSDSIGIATSYVVPLIGFLFLSFYGWKVKSILQKQGIDYDAKV